MDYSNPASKQAKFDEEFTFWKPASKQAKFDQGFTFPRKRRVLLAACGSVAAAKVGLICNFFAGWAEVKVVVTQTSLRFIDKHTIPTGMFLYCDEHEWRTWRRIGDCVLHLELIKWADVMVIAPLSANTLAKIAGGLCDNLLTSIVRNWDYVKPIFFAPSMNSVMWRNILTEQHVICLDDLGMIFIPPVQQTTNGECVFEMADPSSIYATVRRHVEMRALKKGLSDEP